MTGRLSTALWVVLIVLSAVGLYAAKYKVQKIKDETEVVAAQLEEERESLRIISAEWAYLNRPDRLQALNEKYLQLTPVVGEQVSDLAVVGIPTQIPQEGITPTSQHILSPASSAQEVGDNE